LLSRCFTTSGLTGGLFGSGHFIIIFKKKVKRKEKEKEKEKRRKKDTQFIYTYGCDVGLLITRLM
jgi:hypothetical protein